MNQRKIIFTVYILTLAGLIFWLGAIVLAPILIDSSPGISRFLYTIFDPICHQDPDRCFTLFNAPLAVCTRCFGIYIGSLAGLTVYPFLKNFKNTVVPPVELLIIHSLPMGIDAAGNILSLWQTPGWVRLCTGMVWGGILPYYFIAGISEAVLSWRKSLNHRKNVNRIEKNASKEEG